MSGIAAMISWREGAVDFEALRRIGKRQLYRGGVCEAQLRKHAILWENRERLHTAHEPCADDKDGRILVCVDSDTLSARELLEAYRAFGYELTLHLDGNYAAVIYDEGHGEAILVRDAMGQRPLYYTFEQDRMFTASSPRALFTVYQEGLRCPREALERLVMGTLPRPCALYDGIHEVRSGQLTVYSRLGLSVRYDVKQEDLRPCDAPLLLPPPPADANTLYTLLQRALYTDGLPSAEPITLSYMSLLSQSTEDRLTVADPRMGLCPEQARRDADRLGALYGKHVTPTFGRYVLALGAQRRLCRQLRHMLENTVQNNPALCTLVGNELIDKAKQIASPLRRAGAFCRLLQLDMLSRHYSLRRIES